MYVYIYTYTSIYCIYLNPLWVLISIDPTQTQFKQFLISEIKLLYGGQMMT